MRGAVVVGRLHGCKREWHNDVYAHMKNIITEKDSTWSRCGRPHVHSADASGLIIRRPTADYACGFRRRNLATSICSSMPRHVSRSSVWCCDGISCPASSSPSLRMASSLRRRPQAQRPRFSRFHSGHASLRHSPRAVCRQASLHNHALQPPTCLARGHRAPAKRPAHRHKVGARPLPHEGTSQNLTAQRAVCLAHSG